MAEQDIGTRRIVQVMLALWAALILASVVHFRLLEPTGDSFTRGMNRLGAFLGWQAAAALVALILWATSRSLQESSALRRWAMVPVLLHFAAFLGLLALILWARLSGS